MKVYMRRINGNWEWEKVPKEFPLKLPSDAKIFIVDWQLGHEDVRHQTLRNLVDFVLSEPHIYCVLQDFLDNKWLSKYSQVTWGKKSNQQIELEQLQRQIKILQPIFSRFLFQIGSNHTNRYFGLHLTSKRSQEGRNQFNLIYGAILDANPNFKIFDTSEVLIRLKFEGHKSIRVFFIHPSRVGSSRTVQLRIPNYFGAYGVVVGHVHSNIRQVFESRLGKKLKVWFASHLFGVQPEYEKERIGTFEPTKPLVLGWKRDILKGTMEFDAL